jgi:hypothetical protein
VGEGVIHDQPLGQLFSFILFFNRKFHEDFRKVRTDFYYFIWPQIKRIKPITEDFLLKFLTF